MRKGTDSILNGPAISAVAVYGPCALESPPTESEQVSPHPYWNWKLLL